MIEKIINSQIQINFGKSITDTIEKRRSTRAFQNDITHNDKNLLENTCNLTKRGFFGEETEFNYMECNAFLGFNKVLGLLSVMIRNPRHFIIGTIENTENAFISYGYSLEHILLKATEQGIDSCWLGYFNDNLSEVFKIGEDKITPAILCVGYNSKKKGIWDELSKQIKKPRTRKKFGEIFFNGEFGNPLTKESSQQYTSCLENVRVGPSAGNKQPWRIIKEDSSHTYHFYLDSRESYEKKGYEERRLAEIDLGIAIAHFNLTVNEKKLEGNWDFKAPEVKIPENVKYVVSFLGKN